MFDDDDDPLRVFDTGPSDACLGEWKNERLSVRITSQGGKLILESGQRRLSLTALEHNIWSVALVSEPNVELYVAEVTGYGPEVRLLLRQPSRKSDGKTAVLWRADSANGNGRSSLVLKAPQVRALENGTSGGRDDDRARERGRRENDRTEERRSESASTHWRRRSYSRHRTPPRRWSGSPDRERGPRKDKGLGKGEEITTLFVTGLPDDAREDEVRADLEPEGRVLRIVMMKRGGEVNAFVRFETVAEATQAMQAMLGGKLKVCQSRVKAEIARRNTN